MTFIEKIFRRLIRELLIVRHMWVVKDFKNFKKATALHGREAKVSWREWLPMTGDKTAVTPFEPHYTYFPAWAARILSRTKPKEHVDISSFLPFSTLVSAFIPVKFFDYRPAEILLSNLSLGRCDLVHLDFETNSIGSLSCMHVVEHIGLGRYGDQIDAVGDITAMRELVRVLAPGGNLIFVVPMGRPRVQFNAHRIYAYNEIISQFSSLRLVEFVLIPDDAESVGMIYDAPEELCNRQNWGCGCFWFQKPLPSVV